MKGILRNIGLVAAVACVAAPGAFGMVDAASSGGASVVPHVAYNSSHALPQTQLTIPYVSHGHGVDPALFGGTGAPQAEPSYRFVTDTLGGNGGPSVAPTTGGNGFNWGDAGVGMGGAARNLRADERGGLLGQAESQAHGRRLAATRLAAPEDGPGNGPVHSRA